jgi:hypothetical protein
MRIQLGAEHATARPALSAIRDRVQCCEYHRGHSSFSQWREKRKTCTAKPSGADGHVKTRIPRLKAPEPAAECG